ncbi:1,4-alpha-glucan branching protein GlgB [Neptunicella sp. SCSIO 80796]|uniref:1,4-alpha-glucan branching protein GlgB n=1 Tax=Neptunicella plasticusilytica TaxID=3117012 RepID=UPI003A4E1177
MSKEQMVIVDLHQLDALFSGEYVDVFALLGMHQMQDKSLQVRCYLPDAVKVDVLDYKDNRKVASLQCIDPRGLFAAKMGRRVKRFRYKLSVQYPHGKVEIVDPYQFSSLLNDDDLYLFGEGRQQQADRFLGANWGENDGIRGVNFCVWAPNAKRVSVKGDFNFWDGNRHIMRLHPSNGVWEIFLPDVQAGQHYKFEIVTQSGDYLQKADPYATRMQCSPHNASLIPDKDDYIWQDQHWLSDRASRHWHAEPMSIYEVHLPSWRRKGWQGEAYLNYQDLTEQLLPYVLEMGFTHLQLMPISEYPFDGSWGYQPVGMFSPTYRLGDTRGLKQFIDACHQANIAVLLDWVPAHFPTDPHGLTQFDGTHLYEHADPRLGTHPDWNTLIYNYGRGEVRSFLLSNACYWLREFHFDGLRLDAVSSMLYLDYSRQPDQWLPNIYGGRENLQAIDFLKDLNCRMYQSHPGICMVAEESTAWPGVTGRVDNNGLGFGFKWNMGWMNDSLSYLKRDPIHRRYHHHELTFSLVYGYTEQFILSLSHDEVVHGKGSLLHKIPGDDWQKFATLRCYLGFMWGHPGKKLLFMGNEFAQRDEWCHDRSLDWHLLQYGSHQGVQQWIKDLNLLYVGLPALFESDHSPGGFAWLDCDNADLSVFVFIRYANNRDQHAIFVVNMTPEVHQQFRIGVPHNQHYVEVLNSDSEYYGGSNVGNSGKLHVSSTAYQNMPFSCLVTVPPLGCVVLLPESALAEGR